jgi:tetratricopeptide (TPR) repeat protein
MRSPQSLLIPSGRVSVLLFISVHFVFGVVSNAQQPIASSRARERGIELYKQGDTEEATALLRDAVRKNKDDGDAWHYLGLAQVRNGDKEEAAKAFKKAATIRMHDLAPPRAFRDNEPPGLRAQMAKEYAGAGREEDTVRTGNQRRPSRFDDYRIRIQPRFFLT